MTADPSEARLRAFCDLWLTGVTPNPGIDPADVCAVLDRLARAEDVAEHAIRVCNQDAQPEYPGRYSTLRGMIRDLRQALITAAMPGKEG